MKKIIHIVISLDIGGAERMIERLVEETSKDSTVHQTIICLRDYGTIGRKLKKKGFEITSLGMSSVVLAPIIFYKLAKILKIKRPNAVYTWMYHSMIIGGLAASFCGVKNIIWMIRNTEIPQGKFSLTSVIRKLCSILSSYIPDKIVCNAEAGRLFHLKLGFCKENMIVVSNGYNMNSFKPSNNIRKKTRSNLNLAEDSLVVGIVGRFDPLKDHENFVKAAGEISKRFNTVSYTHLTLPTILLV